MGRQVIVGLLALAVLGSALGLVVSRHQGRTLFVELQVLQKKRDDMNIDWGKLQLEQSTWTTHGRIEKLARERLGMVNPRPEDVVIIRP